MSGPNERDEIAAVLEAHRISHHGTTIEGFQLCRCTCGWMPNCFHFGGWERCDRNHRVHVADALTDQLAERDQRTAATAVREAADWMNSAEFKQPEASRYINESHWDDAIVDACDALELRARRIEAGQ